MNKIGVALVKKKKNKHKKKKLNFLKKKKVGYGKMGSVYLDILRKVGQAELLYVVGSNKEKLEKSVTQLGGCKATTNIEDCLKDSKVKAVIISSSEDTHYNFISASLKAGKSVLCEKPLCLSSEQSKECYELAKKNNVTLMTAFNRRFDQSYMRLKENLDNKVIGEHAEMIKLTTREPIGEKPTNHLVYSHLIHDIDMAIWLTGGKKVVDVYAVQSNPHSIIAVLRFDNGIIATLNYSTLINYGYDQRCEVHCAGGMIQLENETISNIQISSAKGKHHDNLKNSFQHRYDESYLRECEHFFDCVQNSKEPSVLAADVIEGARVAETLIAFLEKKQTTYKVETIKKPVLDISLNENAIKKLDKKTVGVVLVGAGQMGKYNFQKII